MDAPECYRRPSRPPAGVWRSPGAEVKGMVAPILERACLEVRPETSAITTRLIGLCPSTRRHDYTLPRSSSIDHFILHSVLLLPAASLLPAWGLRSTSAFPDTSLASACRDISAYTSPRSGSGAGIEGSGAESTRGAFVCSSRPRSRLLRRGVPVQAPHLRTRREHLRSSPHGYRGGVRGVQALWQLGGFLVGTAGNPSSSRYSTSVAISPFLVDPLVVVGGLETRQVHRSGRGMAIQVHWRAATGDDIGGADTRVPCTSRSWVLRTAWVWLFEGRPAPYPAPPRVSVRLHHRPAPAQSSSHFPAYSHLPDLMSRSILIAAYFRSALTSYIDRPQGETPNDVGSVFTQPPASLS
ncbi:hypothetical protein B0H14DRAFT_3482611 [Mycena olivaceomarginata]|nr:hypothetical protein B0H14DRAFT_3482611 [Mycena olivaceomarginata]